MVRKPRRHRVFRDDISKRLSGGKILPRDLLDVEELEIEETDYTQFEDYDLTLFSDNQSEEEDLDILELIDDLSYPDPLSKIYRQTEIILEVGKGLIKTLKEEPSRIQRREYKVKEYGVYPAGTFFYYKDRDQEYSEYYRFIHREDTFEQGAGI